MKVRVHDVKPRKPKAAKQLPEMSRLELEEMMVRTFNQLKRLAREAQQVRNRLARVRIKYQVLKRLVDKETVGRVEQVA